MDSIDRRMYLIFAVAFIFLTVLTSASDTNDTTSQSDKRCKCVCPRVNGTGRAVFILDVIPEQCTCVHVVLPGLSEHHIADPFEFCAKCVCKHENRNSGTIMFVVIAFVVVTGLLMIYMVYLLVEARLCKGTKALAEETSSVAYEQHLDEEDYSFPETTTTGQRSHAATSIPARLNAQMQKWKRAVTQQRGNVYIRRTVLNN